MLFAYFGNIPKVGVRPFWYGHTLGVVQYTGVHFLIQILFLDKGSLQSGCHFHSLLVQLIDIRWVDI